MKNKNTVNEESVLEWMKGNSKLDSKVKLSPSYQYPYPFKGYKFIIFGFIITLSISKQKPKTKRITILNPEYLWAMYEEVPDGQGGVTIASLPNRIKPDEKDTIPIDNLPRRGNTILNGRIIDEIPPRKVIIQ